MNLPTDRPGTCRDCGARNRPGITRCWLCNSELHWPTPSQTRPSGPKPGDIELAELQPNSDTASREEESSEQEFSEIELVPDRPGAPRRSYTIGAILAAMTIFATAGGFSGDAPGLSVLVSLIAIPATLVIMVRASRLRPSRHEVTNVQSVQKLVTVTNTALMVIGLVALLVFAAIAAFFIHCLVQLRGL